MSAERKSKNSKRAGVRDIAAEMNADSIVPGISTMARGVDAVLSIALQMVAYSRSAHLMKF